MIEIDELSYIKYLKIKLILFEDTKEGNISVAKKKYQKIWQL